MACTVLRLSRLFAAAARSRTSCTLRIIVLTRAEKRLTRVSVGSSARKLRGLRCISAPIQFKAVCVLNICDAILATTRLLGWLGDSTWCTRRAG